MELDFLKANIKRITSLRLELFRKRHRELREVFIVQDGGASHIRGRNANIRTKYKDWWKPRFTPANAHG